MDFAFVASFIVYFFVISLTGLIFYRKQKQASDFMLGSRTLNYWVTAIATHASDMSTWLFMAFPGLVFRQGLFACWTAIGLLIGMFIAWTYIAPKLRSRTAQHNSPTLASFFEAHFQDSSGILKIVSAVITLVFFTFYISSGIVGLGRTIEITLGIDYHVGILVGTIVVALYTLLGGFLAVAWNDFIQGMFVLVILLGVPVVAVMATGGVSQTLATITQQKAFALTLFPDFSLSTIGHIIISALGWGLGYFGLPHVLVNFMGIDDVNNMKKARNMGMAWQIISLGGAIAIGMIGIAYFAQTGLAQSEYVFIMMAKDLFAPFVAGLVLCGILAAAITTMDSQILVSASTIAEDLYKKFFNKNASPEKVLTISRLGGFAITLCSFLLAYNNDKSILDLVYYAWAGLGGSFGPLVIASLYWKRLTTQGALAGMVAGAVTAGIWPHLHTSLPGDFALIPAFIMSFVCMYLVTCMTSKKAVS